jgi:hypothetical protein
VGEGVAVIVPPSVFTREFVSSWAAPVIGSVNVIAHGLGRAPKLVIVELECTSADAGYFVGDQVRFGGDAAMPASHGLSIHENAARDTIYLRWSFAVNLVNPGTAAVATIDGAKWRVRVRAWA